MTGDLFENAVSTPRNAPYGFRCAGCGVWVPLEKRDPERRFCGPQCRSDSWDKNHPRVPVRNPDKVSRSQRVLMRLREGPATALELQIAGGGTAATSRVRELRSRGYVIECDMSGVSGEWPRYMLISEPEGE